MVLLIDNYDSFTYNLQGYFLQLHIHCHVIRNDLKSTGEICDMKPEAIVLSPGPKKPQDAGITINIIDIYHKKIPLLGICLGHQALGQYFGATLTLASTPVHGKTSEIMCNNDPIFNGLPPKINVMRYHSLILKNGNNENLEYIAHTESKEIMALTHKLYPVYGFQFHPESILTDHGMKLLSNWIDMYKLRKIPYLKGKSE